MNRSNCRALSRFDIQLCGSEAANKAFQRDVIAVSHLLQKAQKLRHGDSAPEQRR